MKNLLKIMAVAVIGLTLASCGATDPYGNSGYPTGGSRYPNADGTVYRAPDGAIYRQGEVYRDRNGNVYQNGRVITQRTVYNGQNRQLPPGQAKKVYGGSAKDYAPGQMKKRKGYYKNDTRWEDNDQKGTHGNKKPGKR